MAYLKYPWDPQALKFRPASTAAIGQRKWHRALSLPSERPWARRNATAISYWQQC
jgi:hypothetical protein